MCQWWLTHLWSAARVCKFIKEQMEHMQSGFDVTCCSQAHTETWMLFTRNKVVRVDEPSPSTFLSADLTSVTLINTTFPPFHPHYEHEIDPGVVKLFLMHNVWPAVLYEQAKPQC